MDSLQNKLESIFDDSTEDTVDYGPSTSPTTDFKGPFTIAMDFSGSIYNDTDLPYQFKNGIASFNGALISLMCTPCIKDCA